MAKRLFILIIIFSINCCFAFEGVDSLELNLKIRSSLYKTQIQTQMFLGAKVKELILEAVSESNYDETKLNNEIDVLIDQVLSQECCVRERGVGPFLKGAVKDVVKEVREMARKEGVALAVWLGVGEVLELLSPVIATAIGMPQLIVPLELILAPELNVPVILAIKKLIQRRKLIALYGGKENFKRIKNLKKELKTKYGLGDKTLTYDDEDGFYFSIASSSNIGQKFLSVIGLSKSINPISLKRKLKKQGIWNEELNKIKKSDLEPALKSVLIIAYVIKNIENGHELLLENFPKAHFEKDATSDNAKLLLWGQSFAEIETQDELIEWSKKAPSDATSLEVIALWKDVFYPVVMEESEGMGFGTYRKFAKGLSALVAKAEINPSQMWDSYWQQLFQSYLIAD